MLKVALICGGPSHERGISLNSARSVMDHLTCEQIEIIPLYVDLNLDFYQLSLNQLYSNTPSDFDFKLDTLSKKIEKEQLRYFFDSVDLVFPTIHGKFGEDGKLQQLLEEFGVAYVGSKGASCKQMFNKYRASLVLKEHNFFTLPNLCLQKKDLLKKQKIIHFFHQHQLNRAIVKPLQGGSSIGVFSVSSPQEAKQRCEEIFVLEIDDYVLIEPFCIGHEFTVVVLQAHNGQPVALIPTHIEMDYSNHQLLDYRRKYLPTNQVAYHTPPKFDLATVEEIRKGAQQIFDLFQMHDFVRLDGWVLADGQICFADINPISGLEQNSFLFRQTALIGMTHQQTLLYILKNSCLRNKVAFPSFCLDKKKEKKPVYVLFGNNNAERQVSLMSGTNVWLKLLKSDDYRPIPCLYDQKGQVWQLAYSYALEHTVEEVYQSCLNAEKGLEKCSSLVEQICKSLNVEHLPVNSVKKFTLNNFLKKIKTEEAFLFLAMHGGTGEDGTFQKKLEAYQIPFNGSNAAVSAICIDKYLTGALVDQLADPKITSLPKISFKPSTNKLELSDWLATWNHFCTSLNSDKLMIKPRKDGCSAGIVLLTSFKELQLYFDYLQQGASMIPSHTFCRQINAVELPLFHKEEEFLIEPYVQTDQITIQNQRLLHVAMDGWIELTIGLTESRGSYYFFNPSITVAQGAVLTLEEKFQGGTGVNLTPPPSFLISEDHLKFIKDRMQKVAKKLQIQNYARIDLFFNYLTEQIIIIEVNTLPALTPSTVLYHQALAEDPPISPKSLLEKLIDSQLLSFNNFK